VQQAVGLNLTLNVHLVFHNFVSFHLNSYICTGNAKQLLYTTGSTTFAATATQKTITGVQRSPYFTKNLITSSTQQARRAFQPPKCIDNNSTSNVQLKSPPKRSHHTSNMNDNINDDQHEPIVKRAREITPVKSTLFRATIKEQQQECEIVTVITQKSDEKLHRSPKQRGAALTQSKSYGSVFDQFLYKTNI
jgi:hypothetical protein